MKSGWCGLIGLFDEENKDQKSEWYISLFSNLDSQDDFPTVALALEVASQAAGPPPPSKPNPRYGHHE